MSKYKAFVIMPFGSDFNDVYKLGIKATAKECDVDAKRLDDDFFDTNMVEEIYKKINDADFIIADMTGRNPNVFYEVGYADAKNKLVLLLTKNVKDIPFDFKQRLHIEYSDVSSLKEKLKNKIEWAKNEIDKRNQNLIDISFTITSAWLERSEYHDEAIVNYLLVINNLTNEPIEKLQMIDIITGSKWELFLDEKHIKNEDIIENDVKQRRHRIIPEEEIILAKDHIQIQVQGKKYLWNSWDQTEQQDSYNLNGWLEIKVIINNKEIKKRITLNHSIEEFPF
jgi:hypothetical protein